MHLQTKRLYLHYENNQSFHNTNMRKNNRTNKTISTNTENLPIQEYWDKLPKRSNSRDNVLSKIAKLTGREPQSVRRWFLGTNKVPTPRIKLIIATVLECTVETLFPEKSE